MDRDSVDGSQTPDCRRPLLPWARHNRSDSYPPNLLRADRRSRTASTTFFKLWRDRNDSFLRKRFYLSDDDDEAGFDSINEYEFDDQEQDEEESYKALTGTDLSDKIYTRKTTALAAADFQDLSTASPSSDAMPYPPPVSVEENRKRANIRQTILNICKSFVGTGVLVLPRTFYHGGVLATFGTILVFFIVALMCINLLIKAAHAARTDSYGQVGFAAFGTAGRAAVEISLFLSQLGFCSVYTVFIATNLTDVFTSFPTLMAAVPYSHHLFTIGGLMIMQGFIYIPMSLIRRLKGFSSFILLADIFISSGILIISALCLYRVFVVTGPQKIALINPPGLHIMIGTVVFLWEGIGLVLPIQTSMKSHLQHRFPNVLTVSLLCLLALYLMFGTLGYVTFGENVDTFVIGNLQETSLTIIIKVLYVFAVAFSFPLQLFPATKVLEVLIWGHGGRVTTRRKWQKNLLRSLLVVLGISIGYFGSSNLDVFISLVGAVCCLPLAYVFPPLFYMKICVKGFSFWCSLCVLCGLFLMGWNVIQNIYG